MRVEVLGELPGIRQASPETAAGEAAERSAQTFVATVNGDDSIFHAQTVDEALGGTASGNEFTQWGDFLVSFRQAELCGARGLQFRLLEQLTGLLKEAGSAVSLQVLLCLLPLSPQNRKNPGFAIGLRLIATGNSKLQSEMRWGLGLAHVQQALLFASRVFRQQAAQPNI